ncbi:MAG: MchE protein, partial [Planctomycetota bacterium]|nr:MchE protein [Planctomycetota bacterium]
MFATRMTAPTAEPAVVPIPDAMVLKLSEQGRKNLGLVSRPAKPQIYWRTIEVPGAIVDRPGWSDRGVTSPAVGVVTEVHAFPGDTVKPGDSLFTLRLFSEYLQNTQSELFKATREIQLITEQYKRLEEFVKSGSIPESKLIELESQLRRQATLIQSYRQDLLTRGLNTEQIERVAEGTFVSTIEVVAPPAIGPASQPDDIEKVAFQATGTASEGLAFEVQELNIDLGQQVQAGQLLSTLANHQSLFLEGHAFKREAAFLAKAAENKWPVRCTFAEDDDVDWPAFDQTLEIRHLGNSIDPSSRTFNFFIPLNNQSRSYEKDGHTFIVWRFRPGQRIRLQVPVEELNNVLVLPSAAIVREGPEAYVFQQNGDLFNRLPVHVLHEDRLQIVLDNDGSVKSGMYLAQSSAASLNRVLKAQAASGMRADVHVHADGTVHAAH